MRRGFSELSTFQLHFCWHGFTGTWTLSSATVPAHSRAASNARTQMLILDMQAYSAPVWVLTSSVVSHLPDKYRSQNSAPSPLGPFWTFSVFYTHLGNNLEWVEAARESNYFMAHSQTTQLRCGRPVFKLYGLK